MSATVRTLPEPALPPAPARVLVVDPDIRVQHWLAQCLRPHGHRVHAAADAEAIAQAPARGFDLVLMSPRASDGLRGPGRSGAAGAAGDAWLGLRGLRDAAPRLPVIVLQPHADATDRAVALELGADAVLDDCCEPRELRARVSSLLRRHREGPRGLPEAGPAAAGGWRLDPARRGVHAPAHGTDSARFIALSPNEFRLLRALMQQIGRPLARAQLLDQALGASAAQRDRSIDLLVSRLRRTLGDDPAAPRLIRTVRGAGYCFLPLHLDVRHGTPDEVSNGSHEGDMPLTGPAEDSSTGIP